MYTSETFMKQVLETSFKWSSGNVCNVRWIRLRTVYIITFNKHYILFITRLFSPPWMLRLHSFLGLLAYIIILN